MHADFAATQGCHAAVPSALLVFRGVPASSALRVHVFGVCHSGTRAAMAAHRGLLCSLRARPGGTFCIRWRPEAVPGLPLQRGHRDLQPPSPSFPRVTVHRVRACKLGCCLQRQGITTGMDTCVTCRTRVLQARSPRRVALLSLCCSACHVAECFSSCLLRRILEARSCRASACSCSLLVRLCF
jgi:hypothetical protein